MASTQTTDRDRWASVLQQHFGSSRRGLHLGELHETDWHTIVAELVDIEGNVFLVAEVDPDTEALLRCRRPSGPMVRRN